MYSHLLSKISQILEFIIFVILSIISITLLSFYSILDDKENCPKGDTIDGENKIVLFHGPINDSKTDVGYIVSSNSFTEEMFDGFDMALLGDIHKRQTIGGDYIAMLVL